MVAASVAKLRSVNQWIYRIFPALA